MQTEPEQWAVELRDAADAAFDACPHNNHQISLLRLNEHDVHQMCQRQLH